MSSVEVQIAAAGATRGDGPAFRLDLIYYLLAAFDIGVILLTLMLSNSTMEIYQSSALRSTAWSQRVHDFADLAALAQSTNGPGNDVFQSGDVGSERARRDAALASFNRAHADALTALDASEDSDRLSRIRAHLVDVEADMVSMVTESDAIFAHLERGDASVAGRHMALMDAAFADLMGSLLAAVNVVQVAEDEELNAQLRIASRIRLLELVILVLVAAAVVGVTLYGRRVGAMVRQAEEMRVRMVDNLRVANQDLESYADNVAHELRSPVNKMLLSAEVALSRSRTTKDYHEALTSVVEEGRSLSRLVSSLLFLARARSGGVMLDRVRLDLCAELERVLSYFEASAQEKHVALHAKCDAGIGMAADRELVQRALSIVIGNALEHTPAGGRIEVSARLSAGSVHVVVADTGEGIDVAEQERVFERFYRGRGQVEADSERLGLGLAIVRSIMDMHGGVAQLHSVKPGGTTVTLSFPA